ncbi:DUF1441 family protein [Thioalkalivibrio sp. ALJ16]|uniref:DUF1441 family protein n=1 Tax=Thioalkalivibrio sp. ALJ16 TaxID=1158762 RepID=UPI00036AC1D3|nr:DUF1441 family protein [Thioalkalivibrio sp. ALJ16]
MNGHGGKRPGAGRPKGSKTSDHAAQFEQARARKESALADIREMEAGERARTLIPVAEVEEAVATAFARVSSRLKLLPDDLERRGLLTAAEAEQVETIIHETMAGLAEQLENLQGR